MAQQNISNGTKIIIRVLGNVVEGEVVKRELGFTELKKCYFGLGRAKEQATTSFYNQLQTQLKNGVVVKANGKYTLGEKGVELRKMADTEKIDLNIKSEAQQKWEAEHPDATEEQTAIYNA